MNLVAIKDLCKTFSECIAIQNKEENKKLCRNHVADAISLKYLSEQKAKPHTIVAPELSDYKNQKSLLKKAVSITERRHLVFIEKENRCKESMQTENASKEQRNKILLEKRYKALGSDKVNLILKLNELGFKKDQIQAVAFRTNVCRVEEALNYLVKTANEKWQHKFVKANEVQGDYVDLCSKCLPPSSCSTETKTFTLRQFNERRAHSLENDITRTPKFGFIIKNELAQKLQSEAYDRQDIIGCETCFVCGDVLEEHSPDFNIELYQRMKVSKIIITTSNKQISNTELSIIKENTNNSIKDTRKCLICYREHNEVTLERLPCNHSVCSYCLDEYLKHERSNRMREVIRCPADNCKIEVPRHFFSSSSLSKASWENYYMRQREIEVFNRRLLLFCPRCTNPLHFVRDQTSPFRVYCETCCRSACSECHQRFHYGETCTEVLRKTYDIIVCGWKYQLCPKCNEVVRKSPQCNHMVCRKCSTMFCIYCRKEGNGNCKGAQCLINSNVESIGSKVPCSLIPIIVLAYVLIVVFSPLLAIFLLPYLVIVNLKDNFNTNTYEPPNKVNSSLQLLSVSISATQNSVLPSTHFTRKIAPEIVPVANPSKRNKCVILKLIMAAIGTVILSPITFIGIHILALVKLIFCLIN